MSDKDPSDVDPFGLIADEFVEAFRQGQHPSVGEFVRRYPQQAVEIREILPALVLMEKAKSGDDTSGQSRRAGTVGPLSQLGDYQILREIGRGGMGVVYEAQQLSLGRHVAIKVLPAHSLLDPRQLGRFQREARAAAKLHHTNIVPIFGVGEHNGLHYYVMQFIQGLGLDEVLEDLKRLQPGAKGSGSTPRLNGGELRATPREACAADVAQSLLTRGFSPAAAKEAAVPRDSEATTDQHPTPLSQSAESVAIESPRPSEERGEGAATSATPVAGRLSDSFTLSLSPSPLIPRASPLARSGRQPTYWQSVARIGVQVADALDYAHRQGIQHRDIKPSNLLLDTTGTVWVTDFGLAKTDDQQNLTHTGDVLGTYRYMPPEAFEGKTDARGDIYSLGLTLYELLAFRPGFGEADRARLIKLVTTTEPARLGKVNPQVPRDLETIVHKAIDRDPACRYQSARELATDLQHFVDDEPVRARPVGPAERFRRWCRRNPLVASLTAAVAFLLVAGTTVATYFSVDATLARDRADTEAAKAEVKANEALEYAQKEAAERTKALAEKERADREADAARTNLYVLRVNTVQVALESANLPLARDLLDLLRQPGPPSTPHRSSLPWEWNYFWRFCHNDHRTFQGHTEKINCLDFSRDGTRLVSSGDDGTVRLWDAATGTQLKSLALKKSKLPCVAFSPNGARVAIGCEDGTVKLLDAASLQELSVLKGHSKLVRSLAFSPDGARLFTVSEDTHLKVWDVAGAQELRAIPDPAGYSRCVAVSPDGKWLALAGQGSTLRLRDAATGQELRTLAGHGGGVLGVAFSPDGKRLASAGVDRAVKVWDVSSGEELLTLPGHGSEVRSVAFSPDGKRLASGGHDQMLKVWDADSGQEVVTYLGHIRGLYRVAFSPDGRWLTSASSDKTIGLWDTAYRPGPRIHKGHTNQVRAVAFHSDGRRLISVGLDGRIKPWDLVTGQELPSFPGPGAGLLCLALNPDGRFLATGGDPGVVTVLDARTGQNLWAMKGHERWVTHVAFSPDSRWLASGGHDRTVKLWNAATGQELRTLKGHKDDIKGLVFSPDGTRLFSGSNDYTVKEWNLATGQELRTLKGHSEGVADIALSPDGRWLASASHDQTVKLWDLATGQPLRVFRGHSDTVWSVAYHPDGTRLATASWDQTVRLWDTATGLELCTLKGHTDRVLGVAFSPDGGYLASAGGLDLTVRVWDGRPVTSPP
jgi:WD40 repeat protein/serine/threonine protein kinase